ncbi:alpha/beta fold hydrolase [Sphingomonas changnyeongensis]|uniref:Alpha/beta fold hydrolase n=1 Tax=Sphingomonas changnyeongensis TaxID=2698679 RepID=A0A7Z2S4J1_9SPHN|nr:alpha/beta hydrolase [Sphingomonas changnyeongensis]QHL90135.1 alpha/beta fold hydrolase [Sphingomonas changnyeongensis]
MNRRQLLHAGFAALGALAAGPLPAVPARAASRAQPRLNVRTIGTGPDLILIPGLTSGPAVWAGLVRALPGHRIHLVHVAGFAGLPAGGNARGPVLDGLVAELAGHARAARLRAPAVIGHSMGGLLALMLAARHPALVGRVMAVDIVPAPARALGIDPGLGPVARGLVQLMQASPDGRQALAGLVTDLGGGRAGLNGSDPDVVARATGELAALDLTPLLPRITAPLTIVHAVPADAAAAASVRTAYRTAYRAAPGARIIPVGPSGHMVMLDQPARFAAEVRAFLAR